MPCGTRRQTLAYVYTSRLLEPFITFTHTPVTALTTPGGYLKLFVVGQSTGRQNLLCPCKDIQNCLEIYATLSRSTDYHGGGRFCKYCSSLFPWWRLTLSPEQDWAQATLLGAWHATSPFSVLPFPGAFPYWFLWTLISEPTTRNTTWNTTSLNEKHQTLKFTEVFCFALQAISFKKKNKPGDRWKCSIATLHTWN